MFALKVLLLLGGLAAVVAALATPHWEGRLQSDNATWLLDLGRHPVWSPPPAPGYEQFRDEFRDSESFLAVNVYTIEYDYSPIGVALAAALFTWPVCLGCGLAYLAIRGRRRDPVLHCALWVAVGLVTSVVSCVATWCLLGGWGAPFPTCFLALGLSGGVLAGLTTFRAEAADASTSVVG